MHATIFGVATSAAFFPDVRPRSIIYLGLALLLMLASSGEVSGQSDKVSKEIQAGRASLRNKQYADAVKAFDRHIQTSKSNIDEAVYLKALSQYYAKRYDETITTCLKLSKDHPKSSWVHKSRFLQAQAYVQKRDYLNAEAIYETEAARLLSAARKQDVAGVIIHFAAELTKKKEDDLTAPPPNYQRAYKLYTKALEMEIGRDLRDSVSFQRARAIQQAGNAAQAVKDFRAYLAEFDPDWLGIVGSAERASGLKKRSTAAAGKFTLRARYYLAEAQIAAKQVAAAQVNLEDLLKLLGKKDSDSLQADARWLIVRSYRLPSSPRAQLDRALKSARTFLANHKSDPRSVYAAWWIAQSLESAGRADDAIKAYREFIVKQNHALPAGEAATAKIELLGGIPAKLQSDWENQALYQVAQIRFRQRKYAEASKDWQEYIRKYPDGPMWSNSQHGVINAQYEIAIDAVEKKDYAQARKLFDEFLVANPLDQRARSILFLYGQMAYQNAVEQEKLEADDKTPAAKRPNKQQVEKGFQTAIAEWQRLVGKYPKTEESSVALYRIGLIQEEKLGDWQAALESFKQLNWGSKASVAAGRIRMMTKEALAASTERTFRSNEKAIVKLHSRNIQRVKVKQYFLDLEAYFRKTHAVGAIDHLDIALIEPDKSWEVEISDYKRYRPSIQDIEIPFEGKKSGVCLVNVSNENFEATTLLIRSDIDLIVKSSRREALVYVENRRLSKPAGKVKVLLSDGQRVFNTGQTADDGVYRLKADELKTVKSLRAFAIVDGHVASNTISLQGLGFSDGLKPKGYLYTDRPTYQPGELVSFRGIIREVKDGSYQVPVDKKYLVSIKDPSGKLIWEKEHKLGAFGTFDNAVRLDPKTKMGGYILSARERDKTNVVFTREFQVQRFQLEKIRIKIETGEAVYFRGETIEVNAQAEYYWGQPVAGRQVSYFLPDGRRLIGKTDKEGKLNFNFDTSGIPNGRKLSFTVRIDEENVTGRHDVFLARQGFNVSVSPSRSLVLANEPFNATVSTRTPNDLPVGKELTLLVTQREVVQSNPILQAVPWLRSRARQRFEETTIQEHRVKTDPKTGKAVISVKLPAGGTYLLRVTGKDRFDQVVIGESSVSISDDSDKTKLRLFADSDTLEVGDAAKIRLHSRLSKGLALVTLEGESIIEHRVIALKADSSDLALAVDHVHFPNFSICVNAFDGQDLRVARKIFTVKRQLSVTLKPAKKVTQPGEEAEVAVEVVDQLGKPVQAELSLGLVDEALYANFPERTPNILNYFEADSKRFVEFRIGSSAGFRYTGRTKAVIKELLNEQERAARATRQIERLDNVRQQLDQVQGLQLFGNNTRNAIQQEMAQFSRSGNGQAVPQRGAAQMEQADFFDAPGQMAGQQGRQSNRIGSLLDRRQAGERDQSIVQNRQQVRRYFNRLQSNLADDYLVVAEKKDKDAVRREGAEAGVWYPSVMTDKNGKATVKVEMPASTSEWRMTARGITVNTLAGQTTVNVITRKDFFVTLKAPAQLQEGDSVRIIARVHNLTDFEGNVNLKLSVLGGEKLDQELAKRVVKGKVTNKGGTELVFGEIIVPLEASLKLVVEARAGDLSDSVEQTYSVRPWGLEFADHQGGVSSGNATAIVSLPADRRDGSQWMSITVGPRLRQSVIDMALGQASTPWSQKGLNRRHWLAPPDRSGGFVGSDLLAATYALSFARKANASEDQVARLTNRAQALVGSLVVSQQKDGGWIWRIQSSSSHWGVSATSFWALCRARDEGIPVHPDTIKKAETYLRSQFVKVSANANDAKAVLLHALSTNKGADFAHANRLHRERNNLSAPALAYTAMAFVNLDRKEFAAELTSVLASKLAVANEGGKSLLKARGVRNNSWSSDDTETTALAALALMRSTPGARQIKPLVDQLMHSRGAYGFASAKARGPAVAALAHYFEKSRFSEDDYKLTVLINGKPLQQIEVRGAMPSMALAVPRDMLADGDNSVEFRMDGRGEYSYAATLRGFTRNLKDPKSWTYPRIDSRKYYHTPLEYRGKSIGVRSTTQVKNVEVGQRVIVQVSISNYTTSGSFHGYTVVEESIPAGFILVQDSLKGNHKHYEVEGNSIRIYFPTGQSSLRSYSYEIIGYASGNNRILPTVIRDAINPSRMRLGASGSLVVLQPGQKSSDEYKMNDGERFKLGQLHFNDGDHATALRYLSELRRRSPRYSEQQVCRMLLWIYTSKDRYDASQVIDVFEVLRERYPDLEIPYNKILVVGQAYRDLREYERAYLVFRATVDASFINDANVSAVLEDEGQFLGSIDYQEDLWREYPDTPEVSSMYFSISQALYIKAPNAHKLSEQKRSVAILRGGKPVRQSERKPDRISMLKETIRLLTNFMALSPENPLADDAAFSMSNALLALKQYDLVISSCEQFKKRFPDSEFVSGYQYMIALGHFWKHSFPQALRAASVVAEGASKDKFFAQYIIGQIHHAEGQPAKAIDWYEKVKEKYSDAKQAIDYFKEKRISMKDVNIFRPGEKVELNIKYRNIKDAFLQVYRVDLMKLYLREKNLSKITQVSLAGIAPILESTVQLGDGKDYLDKEKAAALKVDQDGAYLVICRGDDLFTSALVLITPLKIEVQEDVNSGRARANIRDVSAKRYVAGVHVKAIGSTDKQFQSGETDLRGIFVADGLNGTATLIARDDQNRYAFYRGTRTLGKPKPPTNARKKQLRVPLPSSSKGKPNYQLNLERGNKAIQDSNWRGYDSFRRGQNRGVQIKKVK